MSTGTPPIFWRTRITMLVSATARSPVDPHGRGQDVMLGALPRLEASAATIDEFAEAPLNQETEICPSGAKVASSSGHFP